MTTIAKDNEGNVTVDSVSLCRLEGPSLINLLSNDIVPGATYKNDYCVYAPDGTKIGKWFVEQYGWKRFWPPSATPQRVERLMQIFHIKSARSWQAIQVLLSEFCDGNKRVRLCGRNRYGNDLQFELIGDGSYFICGDSNAVERTANGDRFAKANDLHWQYSSKYGTLCNVFDDLLLKRLKQLGIHRVVVNNNNYWFRVFRVKHGVRIESLDDHGNQAFIETVID